MYRPIATSTIALILGAGPVLADVTPTQVWDSLRDTYAEMGYQMQVGATDDAGQTLTVTDVVLTPKDEEGEMSLTIPKIVLQQTGGGDVRSAIEGQMNLEVHGKTDEEKPVGFAMTIDAPGNETLTTGTPEAMNHAIVVPEMTLQGRALDKVNDTPIKATLTDLKATQTTNAGENGGREQKLEGAVAKTILTIAASGPATPPEDMPEGSYLPTGADAPQDTFNSTITLEDVTFQGSGKLPGGDYDMASDPSGALKAGYAGQATFAMGALSGSFDSQAGSYDDQAPSKASGTFGASNGTMSMSMDKNGLSYEGMTKQSAVEMTSDDLPFPISYSAAENSFRLSMPVIASDQEQPFALTYGLKDLTLNDQIWQAIDPQSTLPHDPASLMIDLEGMAVLVKNFLDPDFADADTDTSPFLPRKLTIKDVSLDAIGATADITGDLTFGDDPSQPLGKIEGSFTGINGLLDNAVAMGIAPEQQMMGIRMMMAMFARPAENDPDKLTTQLEFREGGSIFANGQQVK